MNGERSGVAVLHLSDVHFGMRDDSGHQERNSNAVLLVAESLRGNVDCIVFTGDLAQRGIFSEFQQGQEWLTELSRILNCPCLIVPGNHDVDRLIADKKQLRAARHGEQEFGNWVPEIQKSHPHILQFLNWFSSSKEDNPHFLNTWKSNPLVDKVSVTLNGYRCIFACLNTALLSCDDDDEKSLCVSVKALNGVLVKLAADTNLVIALGHHPLSSLTAWNAEDFGKVLGQSTGPHAYLHGHLHDAEMTATYSSTGAGLFVGQAGAIYPGSKYPKQFSLVQFRPEESKVISTVYAFNENAGTWQIDNSRSAEIPARLPKNAADTGGGIQTQLPAGNSGHYEVKNPFTEYMANGISPEAVHLLFVERRNSLQDLRTYHDNIVEGQRGTGKTMLLRYFSIEVQKSLLRKPDLNISTVELLNRNKVAFGVYCCLTGAGLDRTDFSAIQNSNRSKLLFSHLATLFLVTKLISSLGSLLEPLDTSNQISARLRRTTCELLRLEYVGDDASLEEFLYFVAKRAQLLRDSAYEHLASCLPGSTQTDFHPWLSLGLTLIPMLEEYKKDIGLQEPFFFLVDDFDRLDATQQSIFFSVAAARRHDLVCFKFGSMSEGIKTNSTTDGRRYSEGDDYDHVPLDWVDGGIDPDNNRAYKDSLDEITKRRLSRAGWPENLKLESIFDNWEAGNKLRAEVKTQALSDFNSATGLIKNQTFDSFWNKQGTARYFKFLAMKKIPHRYAGPATIVEVSSGIYRQFLEVCGRIINAAISRGWRPETGKIGSELQNRSIRDWSSGMFKNLDSAGDLTNLSSGQSVVTGEHLINLANSLTQYFRWRLLSEAKDPEVIAIAVRDAIPQGSFVKSLLDVAVRETLLQRRALDYTNKSGDGRRLPTFQLNRRLVPHVGIGTKVQGRYEIDCAMVELAAKDTEKFLRAMRSSQSDDQPGLDLGGSGDESR